MDKGQLNPKQHGGQQGSEATNAGGAAGGLTGGGGALESFTGGALGGFLGGAQVDDIGGRALGGYTGGAKADDVGGGALGNYTGGAQVDDVGGGALGGFTGRGALGDYAGGARSKITGTAPSGFAGGAPVTYTGGRKGDYTGGVQADDMGGAQGDFAGGPQVKYIGGKSKKGKESDAYYAGGAQGGDAEAAPADYMGDENEKSKELNAYYERGAWGDTTEAAQGDYKGDENEKSKEFNKYYAGGGWGDSNRGYRTGPQLVSMTHYSGGAQVTNALEAQVTNALGDQVTNAPGAKVTNVPGDQVTNAGGAQDMSPAQQSTGDNISLEKQLICSICIEIFKNPVTTSCGHSFCQTCLECHFRYNDRSCPLCKAHQTKIPQVNIILRSVVEQIQKTLKEISNKYTGAPGEVACDICTGRKQKAKKSCLMCLASYCLDHLENHSSSKRLKGHKLVEPVENLDERACLEHGRPLELYSIKKNRCICVRCMDGGQEEVVSVEDEWTEKKAQLEKTKTELQENIKKRKTRVDEINASLKNCQENMENEWWDIDAVFTAVIAIVERAQAEALQPLKERRQVLEKEAKDLMEEIEAEVDLLEKTISELDDISALDDHILFLQRYPSIKDTNNMKVWSEVELDTSLSFGTLRRTTSSLLEEIQQQLEKLTSTELQRIPKFTVDVKLDPNSAHQRLVVSEDGKEVKDGGEDREVPHGPERFDLFSSVLGLNKFTSGKSYWEVKVNNKTGWDLGVARADANRKGKLSLTPDAGYWVTVHYEADKYAAMMAPPVRLSLKEKPEKVGVFVDYEEGLVSFYDVGALSHIYSFTECAFDGKIIPYFSPHPKQDDKNTDPLIISVIKDKQDMKKV